jgi:hypothetical protein
MLLQRVWQTAYNRIVRVWQIIVRIYFHSYNRIRIGETLVEEGLLFGTEKKL